MSKTNYINYQKLLKDGSYYEINLHGKRKRQIKKFFKLIWRNIKKILLILANPLYIVLMVVSVILLFAASIGIILGLVTVFIKFVFGAIILSSSLIVLFVVEPLIAKAMDVLEDYI